MIPARYGSTRLPGKPLAEIDGVPMVVRVFRQARKCSSIARVIVATDDRRIAEVVANAGGDAMMTSREHASGTDRIAEVAREVSAEVYLNVQGDLPFISPADLDALSRAMLSDSSVPMASLMTPIRDEAEWHNPNVVKVVCGANGDALYFSRSSIPHSREGGIPSSAMRHIGVYAYRRDFLFKFASMPPGNLEQIEKLEQLRVLEAGFRIAMVASVEPSLEIDTAQDLDHANRTVRRGG